MAVAMMNWRMAVSFGFDGTPHIRAFIAQIRRSACDAGHTQFVPGMAILEAYGRVAPAAAAARK
jgi:hypothetical protein